MTTFFTADLHLGHARISELCGRPFASADEMNEALISRWNARVTDRDTVFVLGDVCLGKIDISLALIPRLRGHKVLLPGNHDRCWHGHGDKYRAWVERYYAAGFRYIFLAGTVPPFTTGIGTHRADMNHFPYSGDSGDNDRYAAHRPADTGRWLLHGHVHERWRQRGRMINVGVDAWGGYPVSLAEVQDMVRAGEAHSTPLPWDARDFDQSVR